MRSGATRRRAIQQEINQPGGGVGMAGGSRGAGHPSPPVRIIEQPVDDRAQALGRGVGLPDHLAAAGTGQ